MSILYNHTLFKFHTQCTLLVHVLLLRDQVLHQNNVVLTAIRNLGTIFHFLTMTLSINALSTCLVVFLFSHGNAQCFVRQHDCSYGLKVSENVVLEGSKQVKLLGQPLKCNGVEEEESSASWILDYGILKLSIENKDFACILTYTATAEITVGGNESTDALVTTFPSFHHQSSSTALQGRLSWGDSFMNPHFDSCQGGIRGGPCVLYDTSDPVHGSAVVSVLILVVLRRRNEAQCFVFSLSCSFTIIFIDA